MEETKLLSPLKLLFILQSVTFSISAFGSENVESIASWVNQSQCQKDQYLDDANQLKDNSDIQVKKLFAEAANDKNKTCSGVTVPSLNNDQNNEDKSILIFVSLSMPKESLKNLYKDAELKKIPLIIRGLKNNSFKETAEAIKALEISVQIDPNLFEKYEIKTVPTFVATNKHEPLQINGNVSLSYAERKFGEANE